MNIYNEVKRTRKANRRRNIVAILLSIVLVTVFLVSNASSANSGLTVKAVEENLVTEIVEAEEVETEKENVTRTCGGYSEEELEETIEYIQSIEESASSESAKYSDSNNEKYSLTDEEYNLLCKVTFAESTDGSSIKEMTSIASVILKRTTDEEFPDSVAEVVFQEGQFSTTDDGEVYWFEEANVRKVLYMEDIPEEVFVAVDKAIAGEDPTSVMVTDGAIYFYSDRYISDSERAKRENVPEKIKFSDTVFYRSLS